MTKKPQPAPDVAASKRRRRRSPLSPPPTRPRSASPAIRPMAEPDGMQLRLQLLPDRPVFWSACWPSGQVASTSRITYAPWACTRPRSGSMSARYSRSGGWRTCSRRTSAPTGIRPALRAAPTPRRRRCRRARARRRPVRAGDLRQQPNSPAWRRPASHRLQPLWKPGFIYGWRRRALAT